MRPLFRPSLGKRLLLALMLAFALVWGALFALIALNALWQGTGGIDAQLDGTVRALADSLEEAYPSQDAGELMRLLDAIQRRQWENAGILDHGRGPRLFFMVYDGAGAPVYLPPDGPALALADRAAGNGILSDGRYRWHVITAATPHYRVHVLDRADLRRNDVLREVAPELLMYVAIAFAIVLTAALVAVRTGLAPLRRLSERVAARRPDDLSPLDLPVRHQELRPLSEALDTLLARARTAVAREQAFTQDAAHELRTPLVVIAAQAHVLARADSEADRQAAAVRLDGALGRAARVSGQLLALAQVEGVVGRPVQLDVMAALEEAIADFSAREGADGAEFSLDGPVRLMVRAGEPALRSIVDNLLDNALRHGHARHVDVAVVREGHEARVTIRDDGGGIPEEDRERIFARFHRGRGSQAPGAGLGLTIARQAAEAMGGRLELGHATGARDTAFVLYLALSD